MNTFDFDTFARGAEEGHAELRKYLLQKFNNNLKGLNVLDAAAGNGHLSVWLTSQGAEVTAVDNDPAQWGARGIKCRNADLNQPLPFTDSFFDAVISIETIEHLENPYLLLREFSRILKTSGLLIVSTPNTHCVRSRLKVLITGYPVLFEFSEGDLGPNESHIQQVTIGHFLECFKLNNIKFVDLFSVQWSGTRPMVRALLFLTGLILRIPRRVINKSHLKNHYLNVLSKSQLIELDKGEQLFVVGVKK